MTNYTNFLRIAGVFSWTFSKTEDISSIFWLGFKEKILHITLKMCLKANFHDSTYLELPIHLIYAMTTPLIYVKWKAPLN